MYNLNPRTRAKARGTDMAGTRMTGSHRLMFRTCHFSSAVHVLPERLTVVLLVVGHNDGDEVNVTDGGLSNDKIW